VWYTPAGEEFRNWIDAWEEHCVDNEKKNQIKMLIDGQNLVFFFKHDGDVFGAPEQHRVVFARMKQPDEETSKEWIKDAHFTAINLSKVVTGRPAEAIFYSNDLKSVDVVDKDGAYEALVKGSEEIPPQGISIGAKALMAMLRQRAAEAPPEEPDQVINQDKK